MSSVDRRHQAQFTEMAELREELRTLKSNGGSGTSGGMDSWPHSVETRLGQLHGDIRQVLYALIGGFLFLLVAGAVAYNRTDDNLGVLDGRLRSAETKAVEISTKLDGQGEKIDRIENKLDKLIASVDGIATRLDDTTK